MLFRQVSAGFGARCSYAVQRVDTYRFPVIRGTGARRMRDEDPALMPKPSMLRLLDIAELLGVTKQRAHQIAEEKGLPDPARRGCPRPSLEPVPGAGVGEGLARREALALGERPTYGQVSCWLSPGSGSSGG